jgi:hypothetical protein
MDWRKKVRFENGKTGILVWEPIGLLISQKITVPTGARVLVEMAAANLPMLGVYIDRQYSIANIKLDNGEMIKKNTGQVWVRCLELESKL